MSTDQPTPPEGGGEERELTQEEMVAAEMLRRLMTTPVQDVVFQTMATFTDMAAIRMGLGPRGDEDFDLPQAGLAIESLRALLAVTNAIMGEEAAKPFAEPLAQLQMGFAELVEQAKKAREEGGDAPGAGDDAPKGGGASDPRPSQGGQGGDLWTPGGAQGGGKLWTPGEG
jgi:hypothetical protein